MGPDVATAIARAISLQGYDLPGVIGEAAIAARFAGEWTERRRSPAHPAAGQRIYEARVVQECRDAPGSMQRAARGDASLVRKWMTAFHTDIGEPAETVAELVERRIAAGEIFLWEDRGARSMAAVTAPVLGTGACSLMSTHRGSIAGTVMQRRWCAVVTRQLLGNGVPSDAVRGLGQSDFE